MNITIYKYG